MYTRALALEFGHGQPVFTNGDPAELAQLTSFQLPGTSTLSACLPFRSVSSSRFLLPLLLFRKRAPMFSAAHCSVLRWATESRTNTSLRISGDR